MKLIKMMLASIAAIGVALSASAAYLDVATDKDPIAYVVGETATLTFTASAGDYTWAWTATGDDGVKRTGTTAEVAVSCSKPGFVRVEMSATPVGGGTKLSYTASVGFGVGQIQPDSTRPADLKGFWDNRLEAIQNSIDSSKVTMEDAGEANGCHVYKVKLDDLPDGLGPCTGWLSVPKGADSGTKYRADGFFFGYDTSWGSDARAKPANPPNTYIQFRVMAHAFELEQDSAYYTDFKAGTQSRGKTHGLDPVQNADPQNSYFNGMACRDIRAMLFLKTLPAWNGTELTTTGHSQGGLQSIWAGLAPGVTQINPECPWNCNIIGPNAGRVTESKVPITWVAGLDYYDPCFVGRLLSLDCEVNLTRAGLADYTCPPSGVAAFYNTLPQKKSIDWVQGSGHSTIPTVRHDFVLNAEKDTTFDLAKDYADTAEYVYVPPENRTDDGYCGDISGLTGLTNRFVSLGGTWGANDQKYTMLQNAVAAAKAGDVIWIHDGFVCEPESELDYVTDEGSNRSHFRISKRVTLRSVGGDARNHPNPPVLRGRYHDESAGTAIGSKAIRILDIRKDSVGNNPSGALLKGVVLEHSANNDEYGYGGGAIRSDLTWGLEKCVVRNCYSRRGVFRSSNLTIVDCVISNTSGSVHYGTAPLKCYNTRFEADTGCPLYLESRSDTAKSVVSNCVFVGCKGGSAGAISAAHCVQVNDCLFTNCVSTTNEGSSGAIYGWATISNCTFVGNRGGGAKSYGGAVCGASVAKCVLTDCAIVGNFNTNGSSAVGGGIYRAKAVRCRISDNVVCGNGGGACDCVLSDCEVRNNVAKNASSSNGGLGGGVYGGSATNCVIAGNSTKRISTSCGYGGGAWGASLVNCIVTNNTAAGSSGGVYVKSGTTGISLVNCLIAGNVAQGGTGGVASDATDTIAVNCTIVGNTGTSYVGCYGLQMTNCIVWANTGTKDCHFRSQANCWTEDPKFVAGTYELAEDSPCVDKGAIQLWMHDTDNPASVALNGQERIVAYGPDIGACERARPDLPHTHIVQLDLGEHGYRIGGGELLQMVPDGGEIAYPEVKVEGLWKIVGWDQDVTSVTSDMLATAVWEEVDPTDAFAVTFDTEGRGVRTGGGELLQYALPGGSAIAPEITANEGWVFLGWTNDFSNIVADTTVRAKWRVDDGVTKLTGLTNRFVSADGDWGGNSQMYTSLQAAINAAKAGDTIYVQDGYVCDSGSTFSSKSDSRIYFDGSKRNLVVRTISGIVDEANGKGATIRGSKSEPLTRCLAASGSYMITFRGFIFEDGASAGGNSSSYGGGGVLGKAALYDCVVRNCSNCALSTSGTTVQHVIIEKCSSGGICNATAARGLRDCTFRNNTTSPLAWNGATEPWPVVSNCVFYGNSSHCEFSAHPSYHGGCEFRDCVWSNNTYKGYGGAIYGAARCYNCKFFRNVSWHDSSDSGGGAVSGYDSTTDYAALYDCEVAYNICTNYNSNGKGGGVNVARCCRTKIYGNKAEGNGGGAATSWLLGCEIYDNEAVHPSRVSGSNGSLGGGIFNTYATNCVIRGNKAMGYGGDSSPGKGGGVCNTSKWTLFNCLIADNADKGGSGGIYCTDEAAGSKLYNCTIVSNKSNSGCAGVRKASLINSIVWGNTGAADIVTSATNSCAAILTDTVKYPGCITDDPRFNDDGSWTLRFRSPCKDTAMPFKWMTDPADARSKDLAGNDRVAGAGPDMGCYERPTKIGMVILVK